MVKYSKFNLFIRACIFTIYSVISVTLYGVVTLASAFGPLRWRHAIIRSYLRNFILVLKKVCLVNFRIEGLRNIPKDRVGIVMCKHQSAWETLLLPLLFHDPAVITKKELLWVPFFGWGLALSDPIAINRKDRSSAMNQILKKGKKRLDDGRWVLVFPEGTRVPPGTVGHYRLGGARLAAGTGYPIIPIAHNAGRFWPRRSFIKIPGTIKVVIGPPIESHGREPEELLRLTKDWIETTMTRIDRNHQLS